MCGRFSLTTPAAVIAELFGIDLSMLELGPRYNIAPTQRSLIVRDTGDGREGTMARWGFIPPWRKPGESGPEPINARSETAPTGRMFAPAVRRQRCIVPASGFYEWQKVEGEKVKRPHNIVPTDADVFALAGLWSRWAPADAEPVESFTVLTCAPNATMQPIHNRMPVILPADLVGQWLDPAIDDAETIAQMLRPAADNALRAYEVSRWVNTPSHDDERCAEPAHPLIG